MAKPMAVAGRGTDEHEQNDADDADGAVLAVEIGEAPSCTVAAISRIRSLPVGLRRIRQWTPRRRPTPPRADKVQRSDSWTYRAPRLVGVTAVRYGGRRHDYRLPNKSQKTNSNPPVSTIAVAGKRRGVFRPPNSLVKLGTRTLVSPSNRMTVLGRACPCWPRTESASAELPL